MSLVNPKPKGDVTMANGAIFPSADGTWALAEC